MTLFWRLFLSIFAALMLTAGTVAYITHEFRDIPSSEIDPGGAQVLGRTASVVQRGLEEQGLESIRQMQRSRLRPMLFEMDGRPITRVPFFARELAERATPENPRVWSDEGQVLVGPALITFEDRPIKLFLISRAPRGAKQTPPFGLYFVVGTLFSVILAWGLSRLTARRVGALKRWSHELAEDLHTPAPRALAKRKDELGDLTRSLEGMAGQIQDQLEAQRALTRMVSHEVRSPLTRLKLVLDLMERAEDAKALLPRANNAIQSLDTLLEQMLTLSRLEANAWSAEPQSDHWSERFRGWIQEWSEQAEEKGIRIHGKVDNQIRFVGDESLMHIALDNLVRNAISLSEPGQSLDILVRDGLFVQIEDQAGGIPEDQMDRVLEPFVQGVNQSGSTGLGLPIASQIARLHGGQLTLDNIPGGLRVSLSLSGLTG